jgi:hypothetical protein
MKNRLSEFENSKLALGVNAMFASRRVTVNRRKRHTDCTVDGVAGFRTVSSGQPKRRA